jgi:hypothetical protein
MSVSRSARFQVLQKRRSACASDLRNKMRGDTSLCHGLIFPGGISRGREVVGPDDRNESNWLTSPVACGLCCARPVKGHCPLIQLGWNESAGRQWTPGHTVG